jgi:gluconokinase
MILVIMGVSASGKSTVGRLLAERLGWKFCEGDDFHSKASLRKMSRGVPLNDQDRTPWLKAIRKLISTAVEKGENVVIACSALKKSYRRMLEVGEKVIFIYLKADRALIRRRLENRTGHFMNPSLIESQFQALETPHAALQVDAGLPPAEIVRLIRNHLSTRGFLDVALAR